MEDDELEVIRERMEETRSSLADKVDALENTIMGTVESATHSVAETVETVKEKVEGTVETVKEAFNLRRHIERHPWLAMGVSVATGKEHWRFPWAERWLINAADPIFFGNRVFISTFDKGCALLELRGGSTPSVIWENKNMGNHFNSCVKSYYPMEKHKDGSRMKMYFVKCHEDFCGH